MNQGGRKRKAVQTRKREGYQLLPPLGSRYGRGIGTICHSHLRPMRWSVGWEKQWQEQELGERTGVESLSLTAQVGKKWVYFHLLAPPEH